MRTAELETFRIRHEAVRVAWALYGTPYRWAGPNSKPADGRWYFGLDCSGFIVEVLASVGILGHREDLSAAGLLGRFESHRIETPIFAGLVFWMDGNSANHVCLTITEQLCMGAIGGGSEITTLDEALRRDARVKVRPIAYRAGRRVYCDPFAKERGTP